MRITGAVAGAGLVVLLAGCGASSNGNASRASGTPAPSTRSSSAPASPFDTQIGDPRTADLCAGIPTASLTAAGQATRVDRSTPAACSFQIVVPLNHATLQVHLEARTPAEIAADPSSQSLEHQPMSGLDVSSYSTTTECYRTIKARGVVVQVWTPNLRGLPIDSVCAATDVVAKAAAAEISAGRVTHRTFGPDTLVRSSMCAPLTPAALAKLPGGAALELITSDFGLECQTDGSAALDLDVGLGLETADVYRGNDKVTAGGHQLFELGYGQVAQGQTKGGPACQVRSQQAAVPGTSLHEVLRVSAVQFGPATAASRASRVCQFARAVAAFELDALHRR